MAQRHYAQAS